MEKGQIRSQVKNRKFQQGRRKKAKTDDVVQAHNPGVETLQSGLHNKLDKLDPFTLNECKSLIAGKFTTAYFTSRTVRELQQSLLVIAQSIDKYDTMHKVPMFVMQDQAQTEAVCITVLGLYEIEEKPLLAIKYFSGVRGDPESMMRMMSSLSRVHLMQAIHCEVDEVKLMRYLLQKNSEKLNL